MKKFIFLVISLFLLMIAIIVCYIGQVFSFGYGDSLRKYSIAINIDKNCENKLKYIHLLINKSTDKDRIFELPVEMNMSTSGFSRGSWRLQLAIIDAGLRGTEDSFYRTYDCTSITPWKSPKNLKAESYFVYFSSDTQRKKFFNTDYLRIIYEKTKYDDLPDNAVIIIESVDSGVHWMEPKDLDIKTLRNATSPFGKGLLNSYHDGYVNALRKNGEVIQISKKLSKAEVLKILEGKE